MLFEDGQGHAGRPRARRSATALIESIREGWHSSQAAGGCGRAPSVKSSHVRQAAPACAATISAHVITRRCARLGTTARSVARRHRSQHHARERANAWDAPEVPASIPAVAAFVRPPPAMAGGEAAESPEAEDGIEATPGSSSRRHQSGRGCFQHQRQSNNATAGEAESGGTVRLTRQLREACAEPIAVMPKRE